MTRAAPSADLHARWPASANARSVAAHDDPFHASRPFDAERDGFVMGEGAGTISWRRSHTRGSGAQIYGEMLGYGMSGDAYT